MRLVVEGLSLRLEMGLEVRVKVGIMVIIGVEYRETRLKYKRRGEKILLEKKMEMKRDVGRMEKERDNKR